MDTHDIEGKVNLRAKDKSEVRARRQRFIDALRQASEDFRIGKRGAVNHLAAIISWHPATLQKLFTKQKLPERYGRELTTNAATALLLRYEGQIADHEAEIARLKERRNEWLDLTRIVATTPYLTNYRRVPKSAPKQRVRGSLTDWL